MNDTTYAINKLSSGASNQYHDSGTASLLKLSLRIVYREHIDHQLVELNGLNSNLKNGDQATSTDIFNFICYLTTDKFKNHNEEYQSKVGYKFV